MPMRRLVIFVCFLFTFFIAASTMPKIGFTDQLDDINNQLNQLNSALNDSVKATKPLESQLTNMQQQIDSITSQVASIKQDIIVQKKNIDTGYANLNKQQKLLDYTIAHFYVQSYYNSPLLVLLSAKSASEMTQLLTYQKTATDADKAVITNIVLTIQSLETKKANLESEQARLTALEATLSEQSQKLDKLVASAKSYQASLSTQIAQLSQEQQQLIAAKTASLGLPTQAYTSASGCSSDINVDPGFSPRFAAFTYGVPNRVGMNQYGAKGRAEAGQSYSDILNAYYQNIQITTVSTSTNITVNGTNDYGQSFNNQQWNIEDYVKHIYEIPASWPTEALKAQAIAARSYALAETNNGASSICADQHCQEVKQEQNSDAWVQAVNATAGQVMEQGGQPIKAWFSSTHGGYELSGGNAPFSAGWTKSMADSPNGSFSSFADMQANAYDKASPWFYCDWGSRSQYGGTAWLQPSELADIVNVILLSQADSSTTSNLSQTDHGGWDANRVKQELKNRGITPYNSVSGISISADFGQGVVSTVSVSGDAGSQSFAGSTFKTFFNLRAPANIEIVGPLYNVEQK